MIFGKNTCRPGNQLISLCQNSIPYHRHNFWILPVNPWKITLVCSPILRFPIVSSYDRSLVVVLKSRGEEGRTVRTVSCRAATTDRDIFKISYLWSWIKSRCVIEGEKSNSIGNRCSKSTIAMLTDIWWLCSDLGGVRGQWVDLSPWRIKAACSDGMEGHLMDRIQHHEKSW